MSSFKQKTFHAADETLTQIGAIGKSIGNANMSQTIRYCVQQIFNGLPENLKNKPYSEKAGA